jgi:hypothetical protein
MIPPPRDPGISDLTAARLTRLLLTAALLSASLPGCGGDDDQDSARSAPGRTETESPRASIENYGSEADADTKAAIARAVQDFYVARSTGDVAQACTLLSRAIRQELVQRLGEPGQAGDRQCPAALAQLLRNTPARYRARLKQAEVTGARVKGDRGFALIDITAVPEHFIPVERENGAWKVAAVAGSSL